MMHGSTNIKLECYQHCGKTRIKSYNTPTLPVLLHGSETWTIKARDARRITATEMKYMRRTAGYTWTDYKTNTQIANELKITPVWDKLLEYKRNWIQHVNRMPRNRLPRVMKRYSPTCRRNHGRPLKRLLDTWDRNGSTSGPTPWQIYADDEHCGIFWDIFRHCPTILEIFYVIAQLFWRYFTSLPNYFGMF